MKKSNITGVVSYNQYKLVDILLFMVIMAALEAVNVFAIKKWFPDMLFAVSLMFTVSLIVLVRWNFLAAIFPVLHGVLYCAFLSVFQTVGYEEYIIYSVGNSFLLLSWFLFKLIPKEKLFSKWYLTLIYPAVAFVLVLFGRTFAAMCFGTGFVEAIGSYFFTESLNIVFAIIALLILRRVDGMLEDQKTYLKRVARQKEEAKTPKDEVWAGYTELDEEELKKLHDYSGKEEEGDGIDLRDEYPPESR
ncbi:MAG: hypothetical protein K2O28_01205 [Clostridia bacterium]|nr:hypothetical protein [Clostridia bacterium]